MGGQWIGPTQDRLAALARDVAVETFPTYAHGRQRHRVPGQPAPLQGGDPAHQSARAAGYRAGAAAPEPPRPACAARCALGGPERGPLRRADGGDLDAPQHGHGAGSDAARARCRGRVGGAARGHVAAARPLLHPLGGQPRAALRHRGRRAAGPLRRRVAARADPDGGRARRGAGGAGGAGAPHRPRLRGGDGARRRRRRSRPPRDPRARANAGGADRLRPAAAGLPRPAHPAHAARHRRQVHGPVRRAVLAWRRTLRPGHERRRAGQAHLRQLAARRHTRRPARLPRGPVRARARPGAGRGAAGGCARLLRTAVRPARRQARRLRREALGRRGVLARLLRLPPAHRRLDQLRTRAPGADRPPPLGGRRVRHGLERLHGRRASARARARHARCSTGSRKTSGPPAGPGRPPPPRPPRPCRCS